MNTNPIHILRFPTLIGAAAIACVLMSASVAEAQQADGVVMHKVEKGQTLFAIARKYNASVAEIRALNGDLKDGLQVDQIIKVPIKNGAVSAPAVPTPKQAAAPSTSEALPQAGVKYHTVGAGQTLSLIARTYKVSVPDLLKWNNMSSPKIEIGQKLAVSGAVEVPAQNAVTPVTKGGKPAIVSQPTVATPPANDGFEVITPSSSSGISKESGLAIQLEKGLAEGIDQDDANKQQCLHRTAPEGTIIKVKNDLNGLSVYCKVVGKLPDIGPNDRLVIRLSKSAFEKLMPTERRFPVSITYTSTPPKAQAGK